MRIDLRLLDGLKTRLRRGRLAAGLLLGLSLAAPAAFAQGAAVQATMPFAFDDLRVYVPVSAGGRALGAFVLDTGASDVMLDTAQADAIGLKPASETGEEGAGAGKFAMGHAGRLALSVGGVPLEVEAADTGPINAILAPFTGRDVGGIVGAPFLKAHVVTLDFATRTMTLQDPAGFAYSGAGARLPFAFEDGDPVVEGELLLGDGTRLPARLLIDLGAKANLLISEPFAKAHGLPQRLGRSVEAPLGAGIGGPTRYAFARLPGLKVSEGIAASNLVVGVSVGGSLRGGGSFDALLGAGFLQRYRLIIDYSRRVMIFEPRAPAPPDRFDRSGAFVIAEGADYRRFVVQAVVPGSPAAQAGVAAGDVITAVDGHGARGLALWDVRAALSDPQAATARLTLSRGGRRRSARVRLRDLL